MRLTALSATLKSGTVCSLVCAMLAGCSEQSGQVSGKVTYGGKAVPGGLITFRPVDPKHNSVTAELDAEGKFSVVLPAGEVMVSIDNRELEPRSNIPSGAPPGIPLPPEIRAKLSSGKPAGGDKAGDGSDEPRRSSGKYLPIPTKYYAAETSGLKFTIKGGTQPLDIELTD